MNLTKRDIVRELKNNTKMELACSRLFLEKFLEIIKKESFYNNKLVKISGYGTFETKKTVKRIGRNPKTKESYIIGERKKLTLLASNKIKALFN